MLNCIEVMIKAFVNISWTQMNSCETYTRSLTALKDLTAWRMNRTVAEWEKIVPQYRPTKLHVSVAHPSVIHWIPWPSLRDKLIIHHSANPRLDEVISDIGTAYVVQADLSTPIRCSQPVVGYVSAMALVHAVTAGDISYPHEDSTTGYSYANSCGSSAQPFTIGSSRMSPQPCNSYGAAGLPASSANELFGSAQLAKAAHQLLRIGQGTAYNFRLDPSFFETYPELYDSKANIIAHGVRLRPDDGNAYQPCPIPKALDSSIILQYRDFSKIALDCVAV